MKRNYQQLFTLSLVLFYAQFSYAQMLWPGDVNNNGVVNGIDVLYAGIASGSEGPERPGASSDWQAQPLGELWTQSFSDGINYAYADCDGNGEVEEDDVTETIKDNFFLTHGALIPDTYSSGTPATAPLVKLEVQNSNIGINQTLIVDLWLGDDIMPIQNFYGIAIAMSYNPDFTLGSEWEFEEENPWYDPSGENSEKVFVVDEANGIMELAITKMDQQSITGGGKVAEFSVVIEDIAFGLQTDTLNLQIEKIRMIDKDFNTLSVVADSTFVIISRPNATSTLVWDASVNVFPNPTKNAFSISSEYGILGFELMDITGAIVLTSDVNQLYGYATNVSIDAYRLISQLYLLKIFTEKGVVVKKIIIE